MPQQAGEVYEMQRVRTDRCVAGVLAVLVDALVAFVSGMAQAEEGTWVVVMSAERNATGLWDAPLSGLSDGSCGRVVGLLYDGALLQLTGE